MLKLPNTESEILSSHVSNIIINIMELIFSTQGDAKPSPNALFKLRTDLSFAKKVSVFLPEWYPLEMVNAEFIGLYKLLKVKQRYIPTLPMEYLMDRLIEYHLDLIQLMDSGENEEAYIAHLPEPYRRELEEFYREEADGETDEEREDYVQYMLSLFEDIRNYNETCFWDWDFKLLDDITMDQIKNSEVNRECGIIPEEEPSFTIDKNIKITIKVSEWEIDYENEFGPSLT